MRTESEIVEAIRKLHEQEQAIEERQNSVQNMKALQQLERDRQRISNQRHALRWVLEDVELIGLTEGK